MLKKLALPLAICYSLLLAGVSLIHLEDLPKLDIESEDKIFHALAYSVLLFLWFNVFYFKKKIKRSKALLNASVFAFIFGIIIELLQGGLTETRALDIYDIVANLVGVLCAVLLLEVYFRKQVKNH